jgi:hypothetical protein
MSDFPNCLDELRDFAERGSGDPRDAAEEIVREFVARVKNSEVTQIRKRLADTLIAAQSTTVPLPSLNQHTRWLAVLEGACAAARRIKSRAHVAPTMAVIAHHAKKAHL